MYRGTKMITVTKDGKEIGRFKTLEEAQMELCLLGFDVAYKGLKTALRKGTRYMGLEITNTVFDSQEIL